MNELKAFNCVDSDVQEFCEPRLVYLKSEADEVISTIRAERDEYRYNLSCARNEIHNIQASMRDDIKTIAELKADYKEACGRLQTANLIKDEQLAATRHSKHKRCLNMAGEWRNYASFCGMQSHCHNHRGFGKTAEKYTWKEIHGWKCVKRWLKIAEQFKEAK